MSLTSVVVPTIGRPSLRVLLQALADGTRPLDAPVVLVDDRRDGADLDVDDLPLDVQVVRSGGRGPAAARNLGWRSTSTPWVSFLDDDVVPDAHWYDDLLRDLAAAGPGVAGTQGRLRVPLPADRRPTDWERGTAGLETSTWITADLTYRRAALSEVGGFDERFPRAFREDADLGLRVTARCGPIAQGERWVAHPVRPADDLASLRQQAGNADDQLMTALHGPDWKQRAQAPAGRRGRHAAVTGLAGAAALAAGARRPRLAAAAAAGWLAGTAEFAWARIAPGPRDRDEVRRMLLTSAAIPPAATWHTARGWWRHRRPGGPRPAPWRGLPDLVLFDRDGTLVHDVPYNGDPALVAPVAGARAALDRLRALGVRVGIVTNQSGIGSGRITRAQAEAVTDRVVALLGPFDTVHMCPHARDDGCECRKPAPGMVKAACLALDVRPGRCVVVGDIAADVLAAEAAGARGILVPTPVTRPEEVAAAPQVATSLSEAVDRIMRGRW